MKTKRKSVSALLIAAAIAICCLVPVWRAPQEARAEDAYDNASSRSYQILKEFLGTPEDGSENPYWNRTIEQGERNAAYFIAEKFRALELTEYRTSAKPGADKTEDLTDEEKADRLDLDRYLSVFTGKNWSNQEAESYNVAAYLKAPGDVLETVVVGAHYDNVYGVTGTNSSGEKQTLKSHGVYDNGTGVAAMLAAAEKLVANRESLKVNVIFAGFGNEETGLYGSKAFVNGLVGLHEQDFNNLLLMYNLDTVGPGDYLYLYTDEVSNKHDAYLREVGEKNGVSFRENPSDRKMLIYPGGSGSYNTLPYEHVGQMSDHASFYNRGVNVAFFFSMNWDTRGKTGAVESDVYPAIMHTSSDTLAQVEAFYGRTFVKYMDAAVTVVTESVLTGDAFVSAMLEAKAERPDYSFWTNGLYLGLITGGILLLMVGGIVLLYFRCKKKAPKIVKTPPQSGGGKPADPFDVFGGGLSGASGTPPENQDDSPFGKEFEP